MNERRLHGEIATVRTLAAGDADACYALHAALYESVSETAFRVDLAEKDWVVLLRDTSGRIRGFSTLTLLEVAVDGQRVRAVFSGDTGIDPACWGGQALVRTWVRFMGELLADQPGQQLYWFLISKGYRTYLYLPYFFHEFFPRYDRATPPFEADLIAALGRLKYPADFNPVTGVVEFRVSHGHLKVDLAAVPHHRRDDDHVRFFLARNPGYRQGHELVCVAELGAHNMRGLARRMILEGAPAAELVG